MSHVFECFVITAVGFTCSTWGMIDRVHACFHWMFSLFWQFPFSLFFLLDEVCNLSKKINIELKLVSQLNGKVCLLKPFSQESLIRKINTRLFSVQYFVPAKPLFMSIVWLWAHDPFSFVGNKSLLTPSIICSKRCL